MPAGGAGRRPSLPSPDPAAFASRSCRRAGGDCAERALWGRHWPPPGCHAGPCRGRRLFCPPVGWQLRLSFRTISSVTSLAQVRVS